MKSEILNILFISLISILSFFIVKDDLQHKKIKNKFILAGFSVGCGLFLVGFLFGFIQLTYLRAVLINSFLALTVAYLFWLATFWPAGDAKLFALFSFLLPLHFYWKNYLPFFPSIVLLVNIFVCAYVFLLVRSLLHILILICKRDRFLFDFIAEIKVLFLPNGPRLFLKKINFLVIGRSVLMMSGMFFLINYVLSSRGVGFFTLISASVAGMATWLVASLIIKKYIADRESYIESANELMVGVSPLVTEHNSEIFSKSFLKKIGTIRAEGINDEQVGLIKWRLRSRGVNFIDVQKNMPFSPWIIIGLCVTVALKDSIIQFFGKMLY